MDLSKIEGRGDFVSGVIALAKEACIQTLMESLGGEPAMNCGRMQSGNGKAAALVLVVVADEPQTALVLREITPALEGFSLRTGGKYRSTTYDRPGGE